MTRKFVLAPFPTLRSAFRARATQLTHQPKTKPASVDRADGTKEIKNVARLSTPRATRLTGPGFSGSNVTSFLGAIASRPGLAAVIDPGLGQWVHDRYFPKENKISDSFFGCVSKRNRDLHTAGELVFSIANNFEY